MSFDRSDSTPTGDRVNVFETTCRKQMMCPVAVANELSGLRDRIWRMQLRNA